MSSLIRIHRRARGFSLIEVMVAVFVLSIGLLGMAALMATSLRNNQSADHRSQAVNLAYDAIEMMRANVNNTLAYHSPNFSSATAACPGAETPFAYGAGDLFIQDRNYWRRKVCQKLPNGRGRVLIGGNIANGYTAQIDVCWTDNRAADDQEADCPELAAGQFGACSDGGNGAVCVIRITSAI